jgi:nucleoid-associated protein YgaU
MAAEQGLGDNWQAIAQANGIENPRLLAPGQLINLNVRVSNRS